MTLSMHINAISRFFTLLTHRYAAETTSKMQNLPHMKRVLQCITHSIELARSLAHQRNKVTRFDAVDPELVTTLLSVKVTSSMARFGTPTMLHEEPMQGDARSVDGVISDLVPVNMAIPVVKRASSEIDVDLSISPEQHVTPTTTPSKKNKGKKKKEEADFVVKEF